ncbi:MAG: quinone-dependent dihydroorotate dehydrogenase [Deltaproteobacteria bacterium]|nr:quinone-dependent dihydroorotate dehydrogenase [Deltaproteobacteria bacterium]MBI3388337.1 quinone-dependent dihydroorotate dehydrogenase [Deltaproteobacteria bacterium]
MTSEFTSRIASLYRLVRPLLFHLDAETAHHLAFRLLAVAQPVLARRHAYSSAALRQDLWGLTFPNPIGLAAGFDKDARLPRAWAGLGFGYAELGTITAQAQPGNPQPRIFRLASERALINRLGFNNAGAADAAARLSRLDRAQRHIPLGINIGKSRITPIERAVADYRECFRVLAPHADYIVINVSSPNTPGLRDLQGQQHLSELLTALQDDNARLPQRRPLLVKLSPDMADDDLAAAVATIEALRGDGIVATNTTVRRDLLAQPTAEAGGLSGAPLRDLATHTVRRVHQLSGGRLAIIGVGGIFSAEDAYEKLRAGASLLQVYTGFIYQGPSLPIDLCRGLERLLQRDGKARVADAVGTDA